MGPHRKFSARRSSVRPLNVAFQLFEKQQEAAKAKQWVEIDAGIMRGSAGSRW